MSTPLQFESTLTDRYQTTIPETVRRALGIGKRDKLHYILQPDGAVLLTSGQNSDDDDPILSQFLIFLAKDMAEHPTHMQTVSSELLHRIQSLVGGIDIDLNEPLATDEE